LSAFFFNPNPANAFLTGGQGAQPFSEAAWRALMAPFLDVIDILEQQLVANIGVQWFRTPIGDFWFDANNAAPPAFTPPGTNTASANMQQTDNTLWDSNAPVNA